MSRLIGFIAWIIVGGIVALVGAFYDMLWLSPRGLDKVSQARKDIV
jgi:hypothetical protein